MYKIKNIKKGGIYENKNGNWINIPCCYYFCSFLSQGHKSGAKVIKRLNIKDETLKIFSFL